MSAHRLLLLSIAPLLLITTGASSTDCRQANSFNLTDAFTYCFSNRVLTFVNQTKDTDGLILPLDGFSSIAPGAFQDLEISRLWLKLSPNESALDLQPAAFQGLRNLQWLYVENATFSPRRSPFSLLKNVSALLLDGCGLSELPSELFVDFPRLVHFFLFHEAIKNLSPAVFQSASDRFKTFSLIKSELSSIQPGSFQKFREMKTLGLSWNRLTEVPAGTFDGLQRLKFLHLEGNRIAVLPAGALRGLELLDGLFLDDNGMRRIEVGALGNQNLRRLHAKNNELRELTPGVFDGLGRLAELHLQQNKLSRVPSGVFRNLQNLRELRLDENSIGVLEPGAFLGLNLTVLGLSGNLLKNIHPAAFNGLIVTSLDLRGNGVQRAPGVAGQNSTIGRILFD